jgi:hypothetical protein
MTKSGPPKIERSPAAKQKRMDELLVKNRDDAITSKEKVKSEQLVAEAEELVAASAKRLAQVAQKDDGRALTGAVPVTVCVPRQHE